MIKFETLAGSEIERAAMVTGIFPTESALERAVKQQIAKALVRLLNHIAPQGFATPSQASSC